MNSVGIVKVNTLEGRAKLMAEAEGLNSDDLVILTISMEKVVGDPVSYLLSKIQSSEQSSNQRVRESEKMMFPDSDEIEEGKKYPDRLYIDSEWMEDIFQVYVYAEGLEIEFRRPGHNLEIRVYHSSEQEKG